MKMLIKSDCFARQGAKCRILTTVLCNNGKCSFYKTKRQYETDLKRYPPCGYKNNKVKVKTNEK